MKIKQIIALLLCFVLLLPILAGCGSKNIECSDPDCGPGSPPHINFNAAISTFPHETAMIRSGDLVITWAELYVVIFSTVRDLLQSYGAEIPWDDEIDGLTLSELVLEYTTSEAMTFLTYMYGLHSTGFVLADQELAELRQDLDGYIEEMGGKEALEEFLRETSGVYNFEVFERIITLEFSVGFLADQLFGDDGSDFSDDNVEEYAKNQGYDLLMAMHILRMKTDDDDTSLQEAEEILSRLRTQSGSANFTTMFSDEMFEHSEDMGGLMSFPDGYLFVADAMVEEFSDATIALNIGEMSGIVETEYGYHIILRLPVNYDTSLMTRGGTSPGTLRQMAAAGRFESILDDWFDFIEANHEFTSEYNKIDLSAIFAVH